MHTDTYICTHSIHMCMSTHPHMCAAPRLPLGPTEGLSLPWCLPTSCQHSTEGRNRAQPGGQAPGPSLCFPFEDTRARRPTLGAPERTDRRWHTSKGLGCFFLFWMNYLWKELSGCLEVKGRRVMHGIFRNPSQGLRVSRHSTVFVPESGLGKGWRKEGLHG